MPSTTGVKDEGQLTVSSSTKSEMHRCIRPPGFWARHSRGGPPGHQTLPCFQVHGTHLYIPSAKARLPAAFEQPGVGWLLAIAGSNVFQQHARTQSPGRDWLFAGDGTTATSGSIGFHYRALWGQLEPRKEQH